MLDSEPRRSSTQTRRQLLRTTGTAMAVAAIHSQVGGEAAHAQQPTETERPFSDRHPQPMLYFRPGEVTLLLEATGPNVPVENATLDESSVSRLVEFLRLADYPPIAPNQTQAEPLPLVPPGSTAPPPTAQGFGGGSTAIGGPVRPLPFSPMLYQGPRGIRTLIPIQPRLDPPRTLTSGVLQTINLASWSPDSRSRPFADQIAAVRDVGIVVNLINTQIAKSGPIVLGDYLLIAASPNWLGMPFPWLICGSPGGRPSPISPGTPVDQRFQRSDVLREVLRSAGGSRLSFVPAVAATTVSTESEGPVGMGISVAVFDTWPMPYVPPDYPIHRPVPYSLDEIERFRRLHPRRLPAAPMSRLEEAAQGQIVDAMSVYDFASSDVPAEGATLRNSDGQWVDPYRMSDHGLFVADILNQVAPEARLTVYRVLDEWGVGDLDLVARAVAHAFLNLPRPLVLNLSLGFAPQLPILEQLLADPTIPFTDMAQWQQVLYDSITPIRDRATERRARGNLSLEALRRLFNFNPTGGDRVLSIAAAGNDSYRQNDGNMRIAPPRIPAAFEEVVGVSAVAGGGIMGLYSNDDDIDQPDDGVSAFGGQVVPKPSPPHTSGDSPIGLYISAMIPMETLAYQAHPNDVGLARWVGTSFATPVVAGFAAALWSYMGATATPAQIVHAIVTEPDPTSTGDGIRPRSFLALFQR